MIRFNFKGLKYEEDPSVYPVMHDTLLLIRSMEGELESRGGMFLEMGTQFFEKVVRIDKDLQDRSIKIGLEGTIPAVDGTSLADVKYLEAAAYVPGSSRTRLDKSAFVILEPQNALPLFQRVRFELQGSAGPIDGRTGPNLDSRQIGEYSLGHG